jgi:hypothetical protein
MNATRTTYTLRGTLQGPIWWPIGAPMSKTFDYTYQRTNGDLHLTLRELAEAAMAAEDGDFSSAPRFMADTVLTVTRWGRTGHHGRTLDLSQFQSVADYTSPDWPVWDGED